MTIHSQQIKINNNLINCLVVNIIKTTVLITSLFWVTFSFAQHQNIKKTHSIGNCKKPPLNLVITGTVGKTSAKIGQNQTFTDSEGFFSYRYQPNTSTMHRFLLGGFIGHEIPLFHSNLLALDLGLGYYQTNQFSSSGALTQGLDELSSDTYQYSYHVRSHQLLVEAKLLGRVKTYFRPYLLFGIGAALNDSDDYKTTVPVYFQFTPAYAHLLQTNFSSSFELGLDIQVLPTLRLGGGYRYSNLGGLALGRGTIDGDPIQNTLNQRNFHTQQVFFQFTYLPFGTD